MAEQTDNLKSAARPAGIGLGERLQAARIQQGLSVEDIANRMHLNVQIVKSIEDNNFDDITAPIFVKGYLRAYARILSLDEEEMIQQYATYYSHEDPPIAATSHLAPELSVADVRIKWATSLVILGLAALLAVWWWNKNQDEATTISLDSQRSSDAVVQLDVGDGGEAAAERVNDSSESAVRAMTESAAAAEPAAGEAAIEEPGAAQPQVAQAELPAAPESVAPATDVAEPGAAPAVENSAPPVGETQSEILAAAAQEPRQDAMPAAPETAQDSAPAAVRLGAPVLVAPSGSDILSLNITADTWAEVKDANGFQMVYHLLRAGQSLQLTGSAPFSVFLGNGPGVEVRFNGEAIEFSARIRSDSTARLKIGG